MGDFDPDYNYGLLFLKMSEVYREFEAKIMEIKVKREFLQVEAGGFSPRGAFLENCVGGGGGGMPSRCLLPDPILTQSFTGSFKFQLTSTS